MKARYGALVERNAPRGQPIETARRTALAQMKTQWGVTSVGTAGVTRWQEHAPEAIYANAAGTDWIQEQLIKDLSAQGIEARELGIISKAARAYTALEEAATGGILPGPLPARTVFLEPDVMTARDVDATGKPQPKYQIMTIGKLGEIVPLTDKNGRPLPLWFPKYSETDEFKAAVAARQAAIGQPRIVPSFEPGP